MYANIPQLRAYVRNDYREVRINKQSTKFMRKKTHCKIVSSESFKSSFKSQAEIIKYFPACGIFPTTTKLFGQVTILQITFSTWRLCGHD